jgi:alpha-beta hydrolase superfamily lysophospholipase
VAENSDGDTEETGGGKDEASGVKPVWFGPEERPLFGWLHVPEDGQARGGVLLTPALGMEAVSAHFAYRFLADRLAEAGFVSFRFDYDGTGDSAGRQDDPGRVGAWLESVRIAADFVRGLGLGRTSVVGMRIGATLVAEVFGSGPATIDDFVLWDPCASGRAFLREQSALWSFVLGAQSIARPNDEGSVETPGFVYDKESVADLSSLAIANGDGPMAGRLLVLMRANRKGDRRMNERLAMPHADSVHIIGQESLVDVTPDAAKLPVDTVAAIVEWLAAGVKVDETTFVDLKIAGRDHALVGTSSAGVAIEERPVWLGPKGLFGVLTSRVDEEAVAWNGRQAAAPRPLPPIFFLNAGVIDHVGPARLWVELSRIWAEAGFRVIRFDLSGIGDSPLGVDQVGQIVFPPEAMNEVVDVLRDVSPEDPSYSVLVGLSSGGYHAILAAIAGKVLGLCAVNPVLTFAPPEAGVEIPPKLQAGEFDTRRHPKGAMKDRARALFVRDWLKPVIERLPDTAWWFINQLSLEPPPAHTISKAVDAGASVYVIAGNEEAKLLMRGEARVVRRMRRTGRFRVDIVPDLEHSLFERYGREQTSGLLTQHVLGRYGAHNSKD